MKDRQAIWDRTPLYLDSINDYNPDNNINYFDNIDLYTDSEESSKMIPLEDNMPCIADHPIIKQKVAIQNKKLILIIFLYNFTYFRNKQINLFQA